MGHLPDLRIVKHIFIFSRACVLLMFRNVEITETPTNCFLNNLRSCRKKFKAPRLKDSYNNETSR